MDIGAEISWVKNVLNPTVDDATLYNEWIKFRAAIGDPVVVPAEEA